MTVVHDSGVWEPGCPVDDMAGWIQAVTGKTPEDPSIVPLAWASTCRRLFEIRRPELIADVWDEIWEGIPFAGDTVWAVAVESPMNYGKIILPDGSQPPQQDGWVLNVGWGVCRPTPSGRRSLWANPLDLVGARVAWGAFTGVDLGAGALGTPRHDGAGNPIPTRNQYRAWQYWMLKISDLQVLSLKEGGKIR